MKRVWLTCLALALCMACVATPTVVPSPPDVVATPIASVTPEPSPTRPTPTVAPSPTRPAPTNAPTPTPLPTPVPTLRPALTAVPTARATANPRQLGIATQYFTTLRTQYIDLRLNGLDADAEERALRAQIERGISDEALWEMLKATTAKLKDDHSYLLTPAELAAQSAATRLDDGRPRSGIVIGNVRGKPYVTVQQILNDSPAEVAGLRVHDRIVSVNGRAIAAISEPGPWLAQITPLAVGAPGETLTLGVASPNASVRTVRVPLRVLADTAALPTYAPTLGGGVGYLALYDFSAISSLRMQRYLSAYVTRNIVTSLMIDLRQNSGGSIEAMVATLGMVYNGPIGRFSTRNGSTQRMAEGDSIGKSHSMPLVVLIDRESNSAAELFAGTLQLAKRASIVGQRSAGNIEGIVPFRFEGGGTLWLATLRFTTPSGENWEGRGLTPDVSVTANWEDYSADADPYVQAALRRLR